MGYSIFILVTSLVLLGVWLDRQKNKKNAIHIAELDKTKLSDESIIKIQGEFERRLQNNVALPDGIHGRQAYIYWNLMRPWFESLISANRYSDNKSEKVRKDLSDYICLLESRETSKYLSLESNNVEARERYGLESNIETKKILMIENGVASAIGKEALEQLEKARGAEYDAFDRTGREPIAPLGYRYFPISINPYIEEIQIKK